MTLQVSPSFPSEIIREILLKLSVESLLRCKSVCKEWYSLISNHHFIKTHYTLSSTNINFSHLVFIFEGRIGLKSCPLNDVIFDNSVNNALEYPFKSSPAVRIIGSCNGLLCIVIQESSFIYNPSSRKLNKLYCRFKDLNWKWELLGFGYDEFNDDYKVFSVNWDNKVKIYSLKTGKWKNICDFPNDYVLHVPGIFSNGALHWATCDKSSPNMWKIVSLNLAKETYDEVLLPEYGEGDMHLELGALGQCLCVLCNYYETHADLWVLKVYGVKDSWTKLASIPCDPLRDQFSHRNNNSLIFSDPLCISNDGKVLLQFGGEYVVFDSKNISFTFIKEIDGDYQAFTVVESLVPPTYALGICNRLRSSCKRLRNARVRS